MGSTPATNSQKASGAAVQCAKVTDMDGTPSKSLQKMSA